MASAASDLRRHITFRSATALVIANIIGAGIFTTTGFQAADLGHPGWIYTLWLVGGALAFCGAVCFAELGAAMPEAGAEYVYLRESYGAAVAFMSAVVSLFGGFSAPIASAVKSFIRYASHFFPILADEPRVLGTISWNDLLAIAVVWFLVAVQLRGARRGIRLNDALTVLKVAGIVLIVIATIGFGKGVIPDLTRVSVSYAELDRSQLYSALGTSLIFVMFCYSGWNAAAYVASEMTAPQRDLPRALLVGTGLVVVLYLALNAVYFYGAGVDELKGKPEVGLIAARNLFGPTGVTLVTTVLCVSILASASAMTVAGPRVYYALGRDFRQFSALGRSSAVSGSPTRALILQGVVTSGIIVAGRIDQIQQYAGFMLSLFSCMAVSCVIVLRFRRPDLARPFRAWGYPVTPLLFLSVSVWMMFWAARGRPVESGLALLTVVLAGLLFRFSQSRHGPPAAS